MEFENGQTVNIVVASENPVKSGAIEGAFKKLFPELNVQTLKVSVASGVSDQPMSDEETKRGALNRIAGARELHPEADMWAGLEGGIEPTEDGMLGFAWIIVQQMDEASAVRTATFPLPPKVCELISGGMELGHANDLVFHRDNSKQKEGAIGTLTGGLIDRKELYEHAAIMALVPFRNRKLFGDCEIT